jgi:hypothetical protein
VRVFTRVGAWLLGVGAATAGSLLAVSLLGQGIAPSTGQQLTAADVNNALATEATEASEASVPAISLPIPTLPKPQAHKTRPPAPAQAPFETGATPSARPAAPWSAPAPSAPPTKGVVSSPASTALTSRGGTVVAECQPAGAYLLSWSPAQGYETNRVVRGPAVTAQVSFEATANSVTMVVSCSSGVPTATTTVGDG